MAYEYRYGEQIILLVLVLTCAVAARNEKFLERFCKISCNRGRGGNLCGCNGFHFAGKRTSFSDFSENPSSHSQKNYINDINSQGDNGAYDSENLADTFYRPEMHLPESDRLPVEPKRLENARVFIRWLLHKLDEAR